MIRRLRFKLIVVCMLSLLLVITVIMGILNMVNYRDIVRDADGILNILKENSGRFPLLEELYDWRVDGPRYKYPELPFEVRFFSVQMTPEGELLKSETGRIAAVDADTVESYATRAYSSGKEKCSLCKCSRPNIIYHSLFHYLTSFQANCIWHSNDKYRKVIWQCNAKFKNAEKCTTPHLVENEIQQAFTRVFNKMIAGKAFIIDDTTQAMELLTDCRELQEEEIRLQQELSILEGVIRKLIAENAAAAMEQDDYTCRLEAHMERYKAAEVRYTEVQEEIWYRKQMREKLMVFIETLKTTNTPIQEYSEGSWHALVDHATVMENGDIVFTMRNGQEM